MATESSLAHSFPNPRRSPEAGPSSAGQSGDTQDLPEFADAGDESVRELLEEGQSFEAEVLLGVEAAGDDDGAVSEVHTHEVLEDDVPAEYRDTVEPPRSSKN